jgi:hypothetical protein
VAVGADARISKIKKKGVEVEWYTKQEEKENV